MKTKNTARALGQLGYDRKFWTEFLALYQSQTALWDMTNENYKDRCAKIRSYDLLKEKLREQLPGATRDDVLRRINIFRTNYRRERMRALKYRERDRNYQTSLWYFKLLSFLEPQILVKSRTRKSEQNDSQTDQQNHFKAETSIFDVNGEASCNIKRLPLENTAFVVEHDANDMEDLEYFFEDEGRTNDACSDEIKNNHVRHETVESNETQMQYKYANSIAEDFEQSSTQTTRLDEYVVTDEDGNDVAIKNAGTSNPVRVSQTPYSIYPTEIHQKSNEQCSETTVATKTILPSQTAAAYQQQTQSDVEKAYKFSTASEILARSWAVQYDEMSAEQKIYARKEIADILFAGCMGRLGLKQS